MKATKKQFETYVEVQGSGAVNMLDVAAVIDLARELSNIKISREACLDIIHNYSDYEAVYAPVEQS